MFLIMVITEGTPTEKENFKGMIAAGTDPVMHVHMSPGNPCVEIIHSIFHYVAGIGTNDKHNNKMVGFVGDRVGTTDPPCVLIQTKHWEWGKAKHTPAKTAGITNHFADPENCFKLYTIPDKEVLAELFHPKAPMLPEALGRWTVRQERTPWELRIKILAVTSKWTDDEKK